MLPCKYTHIPGCTGVIDEIRLCKPVNQIFDVMKTLKSEPMFQNAERHALLLIIKIQLFVFVHVS